MAGGIYQQRKYNTAVGQTTSADTLYAVGGSNEGDSQPFYARIDFSSITPYATHTDGCILKAGTSSSAISCSTTADMKFISIYTSTSATSGDARSIYNRLYIAGVGGGGESLRSFTTVNNVAGATAHGAHLSLSFADTGSITGLGVAMRGTIHVPNAISGGTYAALQAEIWGDGATSSVSGATEYSFIRCVTDGTTADVKATVDTSGFLFSIQGLTANTGKLVELGTGMGTVTGTLKFKLGADTRYLPFYSAAG